MLINPQNVHTKKINLNPSEEQPKDIKCKLLMLEMKDGHNYSYLENRKEHDSVITKFII